jgi:hypothetical protein
VSSVRRNRCSISARTAGLWTYPELELAAVSRLDDGQVLAYLGVSRSFGQIDLRLAGLDDDLLRRVALALRRAANPSKDVAAIPTYASILSRPELIPAAYPASTDQPWENPTSPARVPVRSS